MIAWIKKIIALYRAAVKTTHLGPGRAAIRQERRTRGAKTARGTWRGGPAATRAGERERRFDRKYIRGEK